LKTPLEKRPVGLDQNMLSRQHNADTKKNSHLPPQKLDTILPAICLGGTPDD